MINLGTPLFDVMKEVRNHEAEYPVLYLYLFNNDHACDNQKSFSEAWIDPTIITVAIQKYYLLLFAGMYISLDSNNKACFTAKDDYTIGYQRQFTQAEIDDLQDRPEFANRVALDQYKVEVRVDGQQKTIEPDMPDESGTDEDFDEDKLEPVPPDH